MLGYVSIGRQLAKPYEIGVELDNLLVFRVLTQEVFMFLSSIVIAKLIGERCEIDVVTATNRCCGGFGQDY